MATASVSNSFLNGSTADADEVNANFTDLVTFLNGSVAHLDASNSFSAVPSGPASNPTSDNQLSRKKYVDDQFKIGSPNIALTSFTPKVYQKDAATWEGNELGLDTSTTSYLRLGPLVVALGSIIFDGTGGTSGDQLFLRTPVGLSAHAHYVFGTFRFIDVSESPDDDYVGIIQGSSSALDDLVGFYLGDWNSGVQTPLFTGGGHLTTVGNGDQLRFGMMFYSTTDTVATT